MTVVESWIVEDKVQDKSAKYDFNVPVGTWMVSMKVDNDEVWNKVKLGEIKGFSIEGFFADKLENKPKLTKEQKLINQILNVLQ